ncbi:MAG: HAMP domain-containing sensor histidine kinase [Peptostreptococcus porci]|nr:HAMP domain-containing sensor histidine kinase [Peptostreptococcus porci]
MFNKLKENIFEKKIKKLKTKIFVMTFVLEIIFAITTVVAIYLLIPAIIESKKLSQPDLLLILQNEIKSDIFLFPGLLVIISLFSLIGSYLISGIVTEPLIRIIDYDKFQMTRKKEFIGAISHDLKTPITVISGQLEGMIYNVGKFKDRDLYLKKCYDATQEMKQLVDKMMEISKNEILNKREASEYIRIDKLIEKSIEKHKFLYEKKNMRLIKNIRTSKKIFANETDIESVLNNIIGNAIMYSPEYNTVIITANEERHTLSGYTVVLTVENTGVTVSKEHLVKIFDPLYRVDSSRNRNSGGSGFGLFFVSQILENYGFKYEMFSRENSTVFKIEFESNNINLCTK